MAPYVLHVKRMGVEAAASAASLAAAHSQVVALENKVRFSLALAYDITDVCYCVHD